MQDVGIPSHMRGPTAMSFPRDWAWSPSIIFLERFAVPAWPTRLHTEIPDTPAIGLRRWQLAEPWLAPHTLVRHARPSPTRSRASRLGHRPPLVRSGIPRA